MPQIDGVRDLQFTVLDSAHIPATFTSRPEFTLSETESSRSDLAVPRSQFTPIPMTGSKGLTRRQPCVPNFDIRSSSFACKGFTAAPFTNPLATVWPS